MSVSTPSLGKAAMIGTQRRPAGPSPATASTGRSPKILTFSRGPVTTRPHSKTATP
jgi:hypothetical protein